MAGFLARKQNPLSRQPLPGASTASTAAFWGRWTRFITDGDSSEVVRHAVRSAPQGYVGGQIGPSARYHLPCQRIIWAAPEGTFGAGEWRRVAGGPGWPGRLSGDAHQGYVEIYLVQLAVGVGAGTVGVVGPGRVEIVGLDGYLGVVAVVEVAVGVLGVGGALADAEARREAPPAVGGVGGPELGVGVRAAAAVAALAVGVTAVIPAGCDVPGGLVERDGREELAAGCLGAVQRDGLGPGSPAVAGVPEHDVQVVAVPRCGLGPYRIHPAVIPARAGVPGQLGFGVDAPVWLGRDEVGVIDAGAG